MEKMKLKFSILREVFLQDENPTSSDISPWLVADPSQDPASDQTPAKHTVITRKTVITTQL